GRGNAARCCRSLRAIRRNSMVAPADHGGLMAMRRCCCILLALLCASIGVTHAGASQSRVVGYVMDREPLPAIDARKLDAVVFSFALVGPAHAVHFPRPDMAARLERLAALRKDNPRL